MKKKLVCVIVMSCALSSFRSSAQSAITTSVIAATEKMYDLQFTSPKRDSMVDAIDSYLVYYQYLHRNSLSNDIPMSLSFDPALPGMHFPGAQQPKKWNIPSNVALPKNKSDLAFYSVPQLASLIRNKKITSVAHKVLYRQVEEIWYYAALCY